MIIDAAGDAFEALVELGALALCESLDGFVETPRPTWCLIGSGILVGPSTLGHGSGWGLFAERAFEVGEEITFYDGCLAFGTEIVRPKGNLTKGSEFNWVATIRGSGYLIYGLTIPLEGRGGGSFINHSTKRVNARLCHHPRGLAYANYYSASNISAMIRNHRFPGITVVAKAKIMRGEEIFIDYGQGTCKRMGIVWPDA